MYLLLRPFILFKTEHSASLDDDVTFGCLPNPARTCWCSDGSVSVCGVFQTAVFEVYSVDQRTARRSQLDTGDLLPSVICC